MSFWLKLRRFALWSAGVLLFLILVCALARRSGGASPELTPERPGLQFFEHSNGMSPVPNRRDT